MKYLCMRRPQTIEAVQFDGSNFSELRDFCGNWITDEAYFEDDPSITIRLIDTRLYTEYTRKVKKGNFVVKTDISRNWPFEVMDENTLNARYCLVARGKLTTMECAFYNETLKEVSKVCN